MVTPSMRRYLALGRGMERSVVAFVAFSVLQFVAIAPMPFLVKRVFDSALADKRLGLLIGLALLILGLQALSSLFGLLASTWILRVSTEIVRRLRRAVYDKLYAVSIHFHETSPIGDLHDRVVIESERVDVMTRGGYAVAVPAAMFAFGLMGVLVFINWPLFIVTVVFVPVVFLVNRLSARMLRRASRHLHASVEQFSDRTFGTLRTMRQTRILGAEAFVRARDDQVLDEAAGAARQHGVTRRAYLDANRFGVAVWVIVILVAGGAGVVDGRLSIGVLFAFYAGLALIRQPLEQIINSVPTIIAGQEALQRIFELLDTDDERPYTGTRELDVAGHVSVVDVCFEYERGQPVLRNVSLDVAPGEVVALVGPNGAGKTSLINLILGFYAPDSGSITIDGSSYAELDMPYLRRQFGVLTQDPVMVPGTVLDNITYGRPDVTTDEVATAIELAAAGDVIAGLEAGLDTRAYENGPLLSGGQLQRIALARALLGRPRLVILDEPSNHLDVDGIAGVLRGLRSFAEPPAMIIITHDPAVAEFADSVLRIERGVMSLVGAAE